MEISIYTCENVTKKIQSAIDEVSRQGGGRVLLNDGEYAEAYVESAGKRKGGKLIRMDLRGKGVADTEIDAALGNLDEETQVDAAKAILTKYMRGKIADTATLQKSYRYLMGKGFDYEVAKAALSSLRDLEDE